VSAAALGGWNVEPGTLVGRGQVAVSEVARVLVCAAGEVVLVEIAAVDLGEIAGIRADRRLNAPQGEVLAWMVESIEGGNFKVWVATDHGVVWRNIALEADMEPGTVDLDFSHWNRFATGFTDQVIMMAWHPSGPLLASSAGIAFVRPSDPCEVLVDALRDILSPNQVVGDPDPTWPPGAILQPNFRRALVERIFPAVKQVEKDVSASRAIEAAMGRWSLGVSESASGGVEALGREVFSLISGISDFKVGLKPTDLAIIMEGICTCLTGEIGAGLRGDGELFPLAGVGLASARVCLSQVSRVREELARVVAVVGLLLVAGGKGGSQKRRLEEATLVLVNSWWHWRSVAAMAEIEIVSIGNQAGAEATSSETRSLVGILKPEGMLLDYLSRTGTSLAVATPSASALPASNAILAALRLMAPPAEPSDISKVKIADKLVKEGLFVEAEHVLSGIRVCGAVQYLTARVSLGTGSWERARLAFWSA
ncbi:hypothetical protein HDU93_004883, partial [Gonapodya sp. JEL0774]